MPITITVVLHESPILHGIQLVYIQHLFHSSRYKNLSHGIMIVSSIKDNAAVDQNCRPYSPSDFSEEETVDVDVTLFIISVVNERLLETEILSVW